MKVKALYLINAIIFSSFLRFIIIPIEDYPDIKNNYWITLDYKNWVGSIARLFRLDKLFDGSCDINQPSSLVNNYIIGGGFYKCTNFPISTNYIYVFFILLSLIIGIFLIFYKLSYKLKDNQRIIFQKTLFLFLLLPATNYFLFMIHTDNLYNFLILPFVMFSFYFSFKERYIKFIPLSIIPFFFVFISNNQDNQFFIVILLLSAYLLSYFLHKRKFIINLYNKLSQQLIYFLNFNFKRYKKIFVILIFTLSIIISFLISSRLDILDGLASDFLGDVPLTSGVSSIASAYGNEDNDLFFTSLDKYPLYIRLFGLLQGLILTTTFGIKPSIFTTFLLIYSILSGFLKCYSKDQVIPLFIKIYFLILLFSAVIIISIFPFFSYAKYWLFFLPFLGLFMSFKSRLSIITIGIIYLELIFKSPWLN